MVPTKLFFREIPMDANTLALMDQIPSELRC